MGQEQAVPNSKGTRPPKLQAPANAADCHIHILDPRFPEPPNKRPSPKHGTVADYRLLQKRNGTTRVVVVQPRAYAIDNRVTIDALKQLGASARGVVVVHPTITDAELKAFDAAGVRGIRFSLGEPTTSVVKIDMVEPLAKRIAPLGWHVQLHAPGDLMVEQAALWQRLPTPLVIDHMGRLPPGVGLAHPAWKVIRGLLDQGRTWIKLAGAYFNTTGEPPEYPGAATIAQAYVKAAPERLVWGSDWPHPSEIHKPERPDDAVLFDLLLEWAPDEATRQKILVTNPEKLYGFA
jgi:predicted TIM-barrel fold metal-dependent hydrolase